MQILLLCAISFAGAAMIPHPALTMEPTSFLSEEPSGVAKVMAQVEERWLEFALQAAALDCESTNNAANCTTNVTKGYAVENFTKSCRTVSKAIISTAAGDRSRVQAYMSNVCGQDSLKGKPEELCLDFSQYLVKEMSEYQHTNLEGGMDLGLVCSDLFNHGIVAQHAEQVKQARLQEQAAKEAEEQRKADEAADAMARAEVDAKATVARQRLEKMQNATADRDAKREEAIAAAVKAQRTADASTAAIVEQNRLKEAADAAAKEAQIAQAKAEAIKQRLNNSTLTNQTVEAKEATHNMTAKSFLAMAPFTFS